MRLARAAVLLGVLLGEGRAAAHFGPAEAPDFGAPECMTVVDVRSDPELMLSYALGYDDTEPELGHIFLPDSKTHSFFAFRGAVVADLPRYRYLPWSGEPPMQLPLWIDRDDVTRAEAAYNPSDAPDFHPADIGDEDLLHARADLAGQWLEVSREPARVPITIEQAERGLLWNLSDVPAGLYQIAGYVFSPPYNAWEPRRGLIKVVDGTRDVPAVMLDSIDGMIYAGQGRRIAGCVDTPAGSTLSAWYHVDGEADDSWHDWRSDVPIATGALDLCFASPQPSLAGLVRLRVAVTAPDGQQTFAYSPDALALFGTAATCTPSESRCCDAPAPEPSAEGAKDTHDAGTDAAVAASASSSPPAPAVTSSPASPPATDDVPTTSGCTPGPPSPSRGGYLTGTFALGWLLWRRGLSRRRAAREQWLALH